jgi:hypothetical protein
MALPMRYINYYLFFSLLFCFSNVSAQDYFGSISNITVEIDGKELKYPFTGGLNNPQPNEVDLNQDGILDLYIFDRSGEVGLTFINEGTPGEASYRYAPSYARQFPEEISNWVILRDFNGDGVMDLFTHPRKVAASNGIIVFTGYYENNRIAFKRLLFDHPDGIIPIVEFNGQITQLYVSNVDYPAIDDMDCDGDLDILTFNIVGGVIELYTNVSIEEGYGRDSLIFELTDDCWGGIFETSIMPDVLLSAMPDDCANLWGGSTPVEERHPGSTLLTLDADADGDKDLILGDITFSTINLVTNGGDCDKAWITEQDANFPSYDVSADIPFFPASYYLDMNNDGVKDLIVAPNAVNGAENYEVMWFYENLGANNNPNFSYQTKTFLIDEIVDLGTGSAPAFFDYNADGLLDLVVGTDGYFEPFGERDSRLFLFENIGTEGLPAFRLVDDNYLNLAEFDSFFGFTPTFGDLDDDGDLDILVGEFNGNLFYAENTAGSGNVASFDDWQPNYMGINVGLNSAPNIVDLDRDGLNDILVGERNVNINFFKNIGTSTSPMFNPDVQSSPNIINLGNINLAIPGSLIAKGAPVIIEQDGTYLLFAGTEDSGVEVYTGIEGNYDGTYNLETENWGNVHFGRRARPAIADIDNDGKLEMIVGNERGGLNAFQTDMTVNSTSSTTQASWEEKISIFPNPASKQFTIQFAEAGRGNVRLFNGIGQLVRSEQWSGMEHQLTINNLPQGVYYVEIDNGVDLTIKRVVITD